MIKRYILLLIVSFSLLTTIYAQDTLTAQQAYQSGDYQQAITLYQQQITEGLTNATIFYNLGNAYFATDELGQALASYHRAVEYAPRDIDIQINMARVRAERQDIVRDEVNPLVQIATLTRQVINLQELTWVTFAIWNLAFLLLIILILRRKQNIILSILTGAALLVLVVCLSSLGFRLYLDQNQPLAIVTVDEATVYSGQDDTFLSLFELHDGAEIRVIDQADEWIKFSLPDGTKGWLPLSAIEIIQIPS